MLPQLRPAFVCFALLTVITGALYPLAVTGVARLMFPRQASGTVIERDGIAVGSELIGQQFSGIRYFWGRPSATSTHPYNGVSSSGSNLGPTNPALLDAVRERTEYLRKYHPDQRGPLPVDLVTASASGLDPHISPAAAEYQITRVSRARGLPVERVQALVAAQTEERLLGIFGERRVNVLRLNLALDALHR